MSKLMCDDYRHTFFILQRHRLLVVDEVLLPVVDKTPVLHRTRREVRQRGHICSEWMIRRIDLILPSGRYITYPPCATAA